MVVVGVISTSMCSTFDGHEALCLCLCLCNCEKLLAGSWRSALLSVWHVERLHGLAYELLQIGITDVTVNKTGRARIT
jgi:hypothetical protein